MKQYPSVQHNHIKGVCYAIVAYVAWGSLPLYWKLLYKIPADEILAHRIFWSFIFVSAIMITSRRINEIKEVIANKKKLMGIFLCGIIISLNWFTYIWAVNHNHVIEASMGYYINPLVSVCLARIVLKEKLAILQRISLVFACVGVGIMTIHYGSVPWIALILAGTFASYGLFKKLVNVGPLIGLTLETFIVMPLALIYIVAKQIKGTGALGSISMSTTLILFCSGVITAVPLLYFAKGANRISLTTLGFLQYIAPTINLFLGVVVFHEPFVSTHLISFGFIWCGIILYSFSQGYAIREVQSVKASKQWR